MVQANDGGANVSVERRPDVDRSGHSDRPVLQRLHHQARAVSHLRRAAGQQHRVRRQPGQSRRRRGQPAADLLRGRRRRERLHRARSEGPQRVLRRQLRRLPEPPRSRDRPAARRSTSTRTTRWAIRRSTSRSASSGPTRSCSRRSIRRCSTPRRSTSGAPPTTARAGSASARTWRARIRRRCRRSGGPITKDQTGVETYAVVFTLAPSRQDINTIWAGLGRRLGARHARRRQELGARHAAGSAGVRAHQPDRSVAAPERRGLSRRQSLPDGRPQAVRLQDRGLRQDVAEDRHRHSRHRFPARRFAKTSSGAACSTSAPSTASTSRSTTAPSGSR